MALRTKEKAFKIFYSGGDAVTAHQDYNLPKKTAYRYFNEWIIVQISNLALRLRDEKTYYANRCDTKFLKIVCKLLESARFGKTVKKSRIELIRELKEYENESYTNTSTIIRLMRD